MLIDLLPAGPARPRTRSSPRRSASTTSRRRSTRCTAARCCARSWSSDGAVRVDQRRHLGHVLPRRRHLGRRQQRLGGRRRHRVRGHRRRARRRRDPARRSATGAVLAIVCTHGHDDHIDAAPGAAPTRTGAPIVPAPGDRVAVGRWSTRTAARRRARRRRASSRSAASTLRVLHTPGHSPGACCLYAPDARAPSSPATPCSRAGRARPAGRTATSRPIVDSIRDRLLTLPPETVVHTGHGDARRSAPRRRTCEEWIARGH